ncbi:hypothetical protein Y032_0122g1033 [Ancylostoma ceylanicum]|uniref:Clc-like protein n=2 Tax=Ancylostoma ceylanicum TaxID=53326 RepID=A0A016T9Q3_9BILA|nr:hypothetical protein Y032_0122g1033 [Ancylostoma ceylanicum]
MCIFSSCGQIVFGIIMFLCLCLTSTATFYASDGRLVSWNCLTQDEQCDPWERKYLEEMQTVAVFMSLAIIAEVACLTWNFITFCACCWKGYIIHPLIALSFLAALFQIIAVIVYALTYKGNIEYEPYHKYDYGFSFWLAVVALQLAGIDVIVAILTVCLGEEGL